MIVRINQFDVPRAETESDWASDGAMGPISYQWPGDARAYEILILERDERNQPLDESFRQSQMRQLIPQAVAALRDPGEEIVVRLDGPFTATELMPALRHVTGPDGDGRFALSEVQKLDPRPGEVIASLRLQPSAARLSALCVDGDVGLERSVRLRAVSVPESLVDPLLDVAATDDERWDEILAQAGFVLSTVRTLKGLHLTTRRFDAATVKGRLMQRLAAAAAGAA